MLVFKNYLHLAFKSCFFCAHSVTGNWTNQWSVHTLRFLTTPQFCLYCLFHLEGWHQFSRGPLSAKALFPNITSIINSMLYPEFPSAFHVIFIFTTFHYIGYMQFQKTKIMAINPITSWQIDGGREMETVADFIFMGSKIITDGDHSREIKRCLLLGWKVTTNLVCVCLSCSVVSNSLRPINCGPPDSSVHEILQERILEQVAIFFIGIFQPRDWTQVSCTAGRFFTVWATKDAHDKPRQYIKKQRHHFADKGPYSQSYDFSSSYILMLELNHK